MWKENKLKKIDSTQKEAIRRILDGGITNPEVLFSYNQYDGHGTRGRKWVQCKHSIAISFVWLKDLTPKLDKTVLPIVVSTKVIQGLEEFLNITNYTLGLKWPNDMIKDEKKIGGVLVQSVNHNKREWIIVGIGLNLTWDPPPKNKYFGSLLTKKIGKPSKKQIVSNISNSMKKIFESINMDDIIHEFNKRDTLYGKLLKININGCEYIGQNCGITKSGGISLRTKGGNIKIFTSGSISLI